MISDEGDEILKDNLAVLAQMRSGGRIDDDTYFKGVVCLAYEYGVNDSMASCVALLALVPETYYRLAQPLQLATDDAYWVVANGLAKLLVAKGLAGLEDDSIKPTQPPAKA